MSAMERKLLAILQENILFYIVMSFDLKVIFKLFLKLDGGGGGFVFSFLIVVGALKM